ncbi:Nn.00g078730.m01.CDS01 [Neocucurbitaria sp. VM-36]
MAASPSALRFEDMPPSPPGDESALDLSSSAGAAPPQTTRYTSWLLHAAKPREHVPEPGPVTRQNGSTVWSHGVLSGGVLIDILEHISATSSKKDWSIALWLQEHYIAPFGRVERLDGLVVTHTEDIAMIKLAYERYVEFVGPGVMVQRLWVPGLEPTYVPARSGSEVKIPALPRHFGQMVWRASDMYYKNGVEVTRQGLGMGDWKDELGWDRKIWMVPDQSGKSDARREQSNLMQSKHIIRHMQPEV